LLSFNTPHTSHPAGSINAEYKSKLRSLAFNLRDAQNPDLRQHVLSSRISPGQLVRMSAADLANKDLAEWRRKIEEEHNKAIELDVDTAAKVRGMAIGRGWSVIGVDGSCCGVTDGRPLRLGVCMRLRWVCRHILKGE
jgi:hypothetical protein